MFACENTSQNSRVFSRGLGEGRHVFFFFAFFHAAAALIGIASRLPVSRCCSVLPEGSVSGRACSKRACEE